MTQESVITSMGAGGPNGHVPSHLHTEPGELNGHAQGYSEQQFEFPEVTVLPGQSTLPGMEGIRGQRPSMEDRGREGVAAGVQAVRERLPRTANAATILGRAGLKTVGGVVTAGEFMDKVGQGVESKLTSAYTAVEGTARARKAVGKVLTEGAGIAAPAVLNANTRRRANKSADKVKRHIDNAATRRQQRREHAAAVVKAAESDEHIGIGSRSKEWLNSKLAARSVRKQRKHMGKLHARALVINRRMDDMAAQRGRVAGYAQQVRGRIGQVREADARSRAREVAERNAARDRRRARLIA